MGTSCFFVVIRIILVQRKKLSFSVPCEHDFHLAISHPCGTVAVNTPEPLSASPFISHAAAVPVGG